MKNRCLPVLLRLPLFFGLFSAFFCFFVSFDFFSTFFKYSLVWYNIRVSVFGHFGYCIIYNYYFPFLAFFIMLVLFFSKRGANGYSQGEGDDDFIHRYNIANFRGGVLC